VYKRQVYGRRLKSNAGSGVSLGKRHTREKKRKN